MAAAVLLGIFAAVLPARSYAAVSNDDTGAKFLQMRLPAGVSVPQATCEQLTQAVGLATSAHRKEARPILAAALAHAARKDAHGPEGKLPCAWVGRLLHAAVGAAPEKASDLVELASSLYPDCADALQSAVELFNDKNVVDDKTVVDDKNGPAVSAPTVASNDATDPTVARNLASDPGGFNLDDPEVRDPGLSGGFGPGFPGAPGFVGSAPGGGLALPSPTSPAVTPVVNS